MLDTKHNSNEHWTGKVLATPIPAAFQFRKERRRNPLIMAMDVYADYQQSSSKLMAAIYLLLLVEFHCWFFFNSHELMLCLSFELDHNKCNWLKANWTTIRVNPKKNWTFHSQSNLMLWHLGLHLICHYKSAIIPSIFL